LLLGQQRCPDVPTDPKCKMGVDWLLRRSVPKCKASLNDAVRCTKKRQTKLVSVVDQGTPQQSALSLVAPFKELYSTTHASDLSTHASVCVECVRPRCNTAMSCFAVLLMRTSNVISCAMISGRLGWRTPTSLSAVKLSLLVGRGGGEGEGEVWGKGC